MFNIIRHLGFPSQLDKILNTEAFFSSPAVSIPPQDREVVVTLREERVKNGLELTHNVPAFLTTFCIILSVSGALKTEHTLLLKNIQDSWVSSLP